MTRSWSVLGGCQLVILQNKVEKLSQGRTTVELLVLPGVFGEAQER
jgi:hypothetical protein